ncbi:pectate lyase family protein [Nocardiopsis xinjiangensis]|uniref:pectate lyase family protein n=1 Tax=Nocardiopsis xinjiangensis TaxID=124285 RepID=UPI0003463FA8|nr:right-handed parallel beta-helix repeat-containing protein [Nocardiopsis xinjiangensis]
MRLHPILLRAPAALLCAALVACSQQQEADPEPSDPPVGADAEQSEADESSPPPEEESEVPVGWVTEVPADSGDEEDEPSRAPEDRAGTGGGATDPVTATDADELADHLETDGPVVVELDGGIDLDGDVQVPSDTTLLGAEEGTELTGGRLVLEGADNVVLNGLAFDTDGTAVAVRDGSRNVWVHRSTFTGGDDGALIEVADGADHVTVSWSRFQEASSALTVGDADDEPGALHVSVHHNHFDGTSGNHPRARNAAHVHVFNNYFRSNADHGVESAHDSNVLVEGNYFQDAEQSVRPAGEDPGNTVARDNLLVDTPQPEIRGEVPDPPYDYELDPATEVPDLIGDGAGVPG